MNVGTRFHTNVCMGVRFEPTSAWACHHPKWTLSRPTHAGSFTLSVSGLEEGWQHPEGSQWQEYLFAWRTSTTAWPVVTCSISLAEELSLINNQLRAPGRGQ